MGAREFIARAKQEGIRYAENRWVFLREFAQNSRDAGATKIRIVTSVQDGRLTIYFTDNGEGMSKSHAHKYLFTLYASSKEGDKESAGRFGVGFWSILLFSPEELIVESNTGDGQQWRLSTTGDLAHPRWSSSELGQSGTRVIVTQKLAGNSSHDRTRSEMKSSLKRYCRYLRQRDRNGSFLSIKLDGQEIAEPFKLDSPCYASFKDGSVEGVVGLGERPKVDLYVRGLLVWQGALLDELRYGAKKVAGIEYSQGQAPVYVLSGNDLNVTLDRRAVIDDAELSRIRRLARRHMRGLMAAYLDGIAPRSLLRRVADVLGGVIEDVKLGSVRWPLLFVICSCLLLLSAVFTAGIMRKGDFEASENNAPETSTREIISNRPRSVTLGNPSVFDGPMIDPLGQASSLLLAYNPPIPLNFRLQAVEQIDAERGMVGGSPKALVPAEPFECRRECVAVAVHLDVAPGLFIIPVPTGYSVESAHITLNEIPVTPLYMGLQKEPVLLFSKKQKGVLSYRVGPAQNGISAQRMEALRKLPEEFELPPNLASQAAQVGNQGPVSSRVDRIVAYVEDALAYDRSDQTALHFARRTGKRASESWFGFVERLGRGDCDVKNSYAIAGLRQIGISARLAVGVVGEKGRASEGMHAWIEYYDNGYKVADATGELPADRTLVNLNAAGPPIRTMGDEDTAASTPTVESRLPSKPVLRLVVIILLIVGVVFVAAIFISLWLLGLRDKRLRIVTKGSEAERSEVAAKMLDNVIVRPEMWHSDLLKHRKLLPLLGSKRRISLKNASLRAEVGKLWHSKKISGLSRRALIRRRIVLDASHEHFGDLVKRLPGAVDLDELSALGPVLCEALPEELGDVRALIGEVNRLLALSGLPRQTVIPCLRLKGNLLQDVDLSKLNVRLRSGWKTRFVGISPHNELVVERAALGRTDLKLAAYLLIDLILSQSSLLRPDKEHVRFVVAQEVLVH